MLTLVYSRWMVCALSFATSNLLSKQHFVTIKTKAFLTSHITITIQGRVVTVDSGIVCFPACGQHHHQLECKE